MPTTLPTDPNCPFCEIVARQERDAREVFRTDQVVAFFPPEPATLGHTLLIPRAHVRDIWSLDLDLASELGRWTVTLADAVKRAMRPDGLNVIQSNGAAATQTVMHLHVHVVPRWKGDAVGRIWPPQTHYSKGQKDDAWEALRREFQG
jgi:histidine triad (HIT) family protein